MGTIKKQITICDEDILNLKNAHAKLVKICEPYVDLEPLTIQSIIERWETTQTGAKIV